MIDPAAAESLQKRLMAAGLAGDQQAMEDLLAEDFQMWMCMTGRSMNRAEMLAYLSTFFASLLHLEHRNVVITPTAEGWVQQMDMYAEHADGTLIAWAPLCIVVRVREGRFARIDHYLDSAAIQSLGRNPHAVDSGRRPAFI